MIPRATYRLQLWKDFGFAQAAALAPYLAELGVSHVYLSSILKARPGSMHGYDITDHGLLNPELGSQDDFRAMIAAFGGCGIGRILDIVPNHMGVGGADNPLWLDVLEWGPDSRYASWFDIDWRVRGDAPHDKLLTPVLGESYGDALKGGGLKLVFADGAFAVWAYGEHKLPISPLTYPAILDGKHAALDRIADEFRDLPQWRPQMAAHATLLKARLAALSRDDTTAAAAIAARVALFNDDWRALERLIAAQRWRLAYFRVAEDEINYRRFFNISELAGLRMELDAVFEYTHQRPLAMLRDGDIDGLRVDHIDGLLDPKAYLEKLRERAGPSVYLVVEKILGSDEALRADWPVEGSTGYDYLNESLGLLVDPRSEAAFTDTWTAFDGGNASFEETAREAKLRILGVEMSAELNALGRALARLADSSPITADLTRGALQRALRQTIASFRVYRTYVDFSGAADAEDRLEIGAAIAAARRADPDLHASVFDFLEAVLCADGPALRERAISVSAAIRVAMKLQQLTGPIMAKGVEDTAFYRDNRFIALNEVGGAPDLFGRPPSAFHETNARRARTLPHAMLATATHDTKRGEDARARLAVLSEIPEEWRAQTATWSRILRGEDGAKAAPARDDEYLFYQMLIGSGPMEFMEHALPQALEDYRGRLDGALRKALREAKRRTSWAAPNAEYEGAMLAFVADSLRNAAFLDSLLPFARRVARLGVDNSLAQIALKLTAPGVPDTYQGCELWDFSLVDPDNRRAVDYAERARALVAITSATPGDLMAGWGDGRVKLATISRLLAFRKAHPPLFAQGEYAPIEIVGEHAECAFGFERVLGDARIAVLVALRPATRQATTGWDAAATLPRRAWRDVFDGAPIRFDRPLRELFQPLPFIVAVCQDAN